MIRFVQPLAGPQEAPNILVIIDFVTVLDGMDHFFFRNILLTD